MPAHMATSIMFRDAHDPCTVPCRALALTQAFLSLRLGSPLPQ